MRAARCTCSSLRTPRLRPLRRWLAALLILTPSAAAAQTVASDTTDSAAPGIFLVPDPAVAAAAERSDEATAATGAVEAWQARQTDGVDGTMVLALTLDADGRAVEAEARSVRGFNAAFVEATLAAIRPLSFPEIAGRSIAFVYAVPAEPEREERRLLETAVFVGAIVLAVSLVQRLLD